MDARRFSAEKQALWGLGTPFAKETRMFAPLNHETTEKDMRLDKILSVALVATLALSLASQASAQRGAIGVGFAKVGHHNSINVGIGIGFNNYHRGGGVVIVDRFPTRCWVPGYYQTVCEQVWIPGCGCERQVWIEPVYQTICEPCCGTRQVLVTAGYYRTVVENAGHYETRTRQVWVEGFYR